MSNPFGIDPAPTEAVEFEEEATRSRRPLIIGAAAVGTVAALTGGYFLTAGGGDDEAAAAPVVRHTPRASATASASPTDSPSASPSATVKPQFSRNPFLALVSEGSGSSGSEYASAGTGSVTSGTSGSSSSGSSVGNSVTSPNLSTSTGSSASSGTATSGSAAKGVSETNPSTSTTPSPASTRTIVTPARSAILIAYVGRLGGKDVFLVNGTPFHAKAGSKIPGTPVLVRTINATHTATKVSYAGQSRILTRKVALWVNVRTSELTGSTRTTAGSATAARKPGFN